MYRPVLHYLLSYVTLCKAGVRLHRPWPPAVRTAEAHGVCGGCGGGSATRQKSATQKIQLNTKAPSCTERPGDHLYRGCIEFIRRAYRRVPYVYNILSLRTHVTARAEARTRPEGSALVSSLSLSLSLRLSLRRRRRRRRNGMSKLLITRGAIRSDIWYKQN